MRANEAWESGLETLKQEGNGGCGRATAVSAFARGASAAHGGRRAKRFGRKGPPSGDGALRRDNHPFEGAASERVRLQCARKDSSCDEPPLLSPPSPLSSPHRRSPAKSPCRRPMPLSVPSLGPASRRSWKTS